jgi:lipopolysaccharide export system protein LptA
MLPALRYLTQFILFLTLWFLWPRELDGFVVGKDGRISVPDYAMTNSRYVSVREGKLELESFAQEASFDLRERRMDSRDVRMNFYNKEGQKTVVTGDRAEFYLHLRKVNISGNVRSESPDGFELRGPEAQYLMVPKLFTAPKPVEGATKDQSMRVWGDRAESSLDERKIYLYENARAQYNEPKRGLTKVRGDKAMLDRENEAVKFEKNVQVEQDKIVATGQNALLYYAKPTKSVSYMSITEDVKILEKGGRYTRSQVAEFSAPTDTITLKGLPSVYDGDDAVTGDKITLYRTTGVVEVTATNAAASQNRMDRKLRPSASSEEDKELIP